MPGRVCDATVAAALGIEAPAAAAAAGAATEAAAAAAGVTPGTFSRLIDGGCELSATTADV